MPGHRSGVRAVALSDDDKLLVSACSGKIVFHVMCRASLLIMEPLQQPSKCGTLRRVILCERSRQAMCFVLLLFLGTATYCFLPDSLNIHLASFIGQLQVLAGTKNGEVLLFDLASASLLQSETAHTGAVWSLALRPDKRGFASGSADKDVRFWDFELLDDPAFSTV